MDRDSAAEVGRGEYISTAETRTKYGIMCGNAKMDTKQVSNVNTGNLRGVFE